MTEEQTAQTVVKPHREASFPEGSFVISVVEGVDKGTHFTLDESHASRMLIGLSPVCDLRLTDPEVSRRHAALELFESGLRLTDLSSTNGTFVDRVKIREADLLGGEIIRVGSTVISIECESGEVQPAPSPRTSFGKIIGASRTMRRLYPFCERLASSTVAVVIEGETGTGKEVLAESIHESGPRATGPFVVFDCTTAPPGLVESELFGHERGAFTGAVSTRKGVFEQAHGGTLLIDEIGDLDLPLQAKLLRAIEKGEIRRLGSERWIKVDVRLLAATRRDLDREVEAGRFRDDLFHRLAVARIELPPLRDRTGDIAVLARHIWRSLGGDEHLLTAEVVSKWEEDSWPGNVRELRNAVARKFALGDLADFESRHGDDPEDASKPIAGVDTLARVIDQGLPFVQARQQVMEEFERRYVTRVLEQHGGDVAKAASASGIGRRYFQMIRARNR